MNDRANFWFLVGFFSFLGFAAHSQELPDSCQLPAERFYLQLEQDPESIVLDVRDTTEDRTLGIGGAILAPEPSTLLHIMDTVPTYSTLYVYCSYGDRSEQALQFILKRYPRHRFFHLKKGLERWKKLQYPLDTLKVP
jgi:rhodanese-related sulfurtransferase